MSSFPSTTNASWYGKWGLFLWNLYTNIQEVHHTVKLTRAKLLANAGNFTCGLHVKRPHTQFTCSTCSLPAKRGKFTRAHAASTSRREHADCLQLHVNLPEYNGYFTGSFSCGTHTKLPAIKHATLPAFANQNTCKLQKKTQEWQAKVPAIAGKIIRSCGQSAITLRVNSPATCS